MPLTHYYITSFFIIFILVKTSLYIFFTFFIENWRRTESKQFTSVDASITNYFINCYVFVVRTTCVLFTVSFCPLVAPRCNLYQPDGGGHTRTRTRTRTHTVCFRTPVQQQKESVAHSGSIYISLQFGICFGPQAFFKISKKKYALHVIQATPT